MKVKSYILNMKTPFVVDRSVLSQGLSEYDFLKSDYCVLEFDCYHTLNLYFSFNGS